MNRLYRGRKLVGEMDEDGTVYFYIGSQRKISGHVQVDGTVVSAEEQIKGRVDESGNILTVSGLLIGKVDVQGIVTRNGESFGFVQGNEVFRSGAALLLLYIEEEVVIIRQEPPYAWIVKVIIAGVVLMVVLFALAFVAATAIIWAVMLLLTWISTLYLAHAFSKSFPDDQIETFSVIQQPTKKGTKTLIAMDSLHPYLSFYPYLFLALVPGLWYGVALALVSLLFSPPQGAFANIIIIVIAYIAGAVLSFRLARKQLYHKLSKALLASKELIANSSVSLLGHKPIPTPKWERLALYSQVGIGITFLIGSLCVAVKLGSYIPRSPESLSVSSPRPTELSNRSVSLAKPELPVPSPASEPKEETKTESTDEVESQTTAFTRFEDKASWTVDASSTHKPMHDSASNVSVLYASQNTIDGATDTSWCEGIAGDGAGEWLRVHFPTLRTVSQIGVVTGYRKRSVRYGDLFTYNNRLQDVLFEFSDGVPIRHTFADQEQMQVVRLQVPKRTQFIKITILSVYPSKPVQPGKERWHDTCIAELDVWGCERTGSSQL